ncbi:aminotransferase family protein [Marinicrinis sediminis]|uniref:Aspartate aminotransferase family protein n=1 Tax=Marinicrinis sediminis TaxID=1652465 RepID=A0ABW5RFN9_9BACL
MASSHVLHPFTYMPPVSQRNGEEWLKLVMGEGCWVYDEQDTAYLYTTTAVPALGFGQKQIQKRLHRQYRKLSFASICASTHEHVEELAQRLIDVTSSRFSQVFFSNDGSGAVESAMKLSRLYHAMRGEPERTGFISFSGNYHGTTFASGSVTDMGIDGVFGPGLEQCWIAPFPRNHLDLDQLEQQMLEKGTDQIAAVLVEPIQGVGGIVAMPDACFAQIRQLCNKYGILLIADEVTTGLGRAGTWSVSEDQQLHADLIVYGKGLTAGYFPMAATLITDDMVQTLFASGGIFLHGATLSGHPVGCAAALEVLNIMERKQLVRRSAQLGAVILQKLQHRLHDYECVRETRGRGLMLAVSFQTAAKESVGADWGTRFSGYLREAGILANFFNSDLIMYPPLTISDQEAQFLIEGVVYAVERMETGGG